MKSLLYIPLVIAILPAAAADLDHSVWDALLNRYVNSEARVDYKEWKVQSLAELDRYLYRLADPWPAGMPQAETKAALINAYNALTVRWVLANYPIESLQRTREAFKAERHRLNGRSTSLDKIENELRKMGDARVHAVLVCAAGSCPPLRREAYVAGHIENQMNDNARTWLANPELNRLVPEQHIIQISLIFKWYSGDFEASGGIKPFLARFAPSEWVELIRKPDTKLEFKPYNWDLNDISYPTTALQRDSRRLAKEGLE